MFSSEVQKDAFLFFKKAKVLMLTNQNVYMIHKKKKIIKKKSAIKDLLGVTTGLIID